ncbi:hypothetical protein BN12_370012 [Nostocoides japonicum T1-X7]|uniref:Peptide deformylase n=1 Tax=Nostocoides japonicum T1-X7 TaxID=1194083 RepID=A0A077M3Y6_9MICO|nr:hypothetical protein BN12_370012 [Tetrasphaera japonica T1-X7]
MPSPLAARRRSCLHTALKGIIRSHRAAPGSTPARHRRPGSAEAAQEPFHPTPGGAGPLRHRGMSIRPVLITGDPVLNRRAHPVETIDDETRTLIGDMFASLPPSLRGTGHRDSRPRTPHPRPSGHAHPRWSSP